VSLSHPSLTAAGKPSPTPDGADVLNRIRRHLCVHEDRRQLLQGSVSSPGSDPNEDYWWRRSWRFTSHAAATAQGVPGRQSPSPRWWVLAGKYQGRLDSARNSARKSPAVTPRRPINGPLRRAQYRYPAAER
jgi:hypothetical protein